MLERDARARLPGARTRVRAWLIAVVTACALLVACGDESENPQPFVAPVGTGGSNALPVAPAGAPAPQVDMPQPMQIGSAGMTAIAGSMAMPSGEAGAPAAAAGHAGSEMHAHQPCIDPEPVAASDATLTALYEPWKSATGAVDLMLPKPVVTWMDERLFREGHDGWHIVRKCNGGRLGIPGMMHELCMNAELKPKEQECEGTTDGYQFLVSHRHMIQALSQAFPQHAEMFQGFPKFPFAAQDVPEPWRDRWGRGWSAQIVETATQLEDIENQLARFPTEGDLGRFIQCGGMAAGGGFSSPQSAIHGAMHFKWIVNGSPALLGNQGTNVANFMFWKLHGWIDKIWERYRVAKGLAPDEPALKQALTDQCKEMHMVGRALGPQLGQPPPLPEESGYFHESVRPILEATCAGCHSGRSPEGQLLLGGPVSSADIVKGLVGVATVHGGQLKRVVAGNPDQSWFYLKPAGRAGMAGCTGTCNTQVMPPTGMVTLTDSELSTIRKWIMDGAPAPTAK